MISPGAEWSERVDRWRELAVFAIVLAGAFAIPLVFHRDPYDMFRLPKAIALRGEAILLVTVAAGTSLLGATTPRLKWRDPWLLLPFAGMVVFVLLTLTSTNRTLSLDALISAAATIVVFYATVFAARIGGWSLVAAPLIAATINAILVVIEETNLWMPFGEQPGIRHHLQCDALVGNPNEVGGYLGAALLICVAGVAARDAEERSSVRNVFIAAILAVGLLASQTLTAMIAFAAAVFCMLALSSWRTAVRLALVMIPAVVLLVLLAPPLRARASNVAHWVRAGDYNSVFTERFTPFVTAWSMFTEHPLTGVGPNAFAWQYYDYKIRAEQEHPSLRRAYNRGVNFGEVHNDHLQALAEGGILGYGSFVALIVSVGWLSFARNGGAPADSRQRFVQRLALPLAVFWLVLSIAQFPMETTVVRTLLVHAAALCVGWRNS